MNEPYAREERPGIAALADRPVDGRAVARVMAIVALVASAACVLAVEGLLASANDEPESARLLRRHPTAPSTSRSAPRRVALVLIDGMRTDEAKALASFRALAPHAVTGQLAVPTPTLSRPFYHLLFTGVPPSASGVRSNRFAGRARHDSVIDRVRDAGGSVAFVAEGLDWMRRMHGRRGDAGSDASHSIEPDALAAHLRAFRHARAPSLLVVHVTSTDATAHRHGVRSPEHARALERADRVIAAVARDEEAVLFVLSDHGHRDAGGHGGPEPEVARVPLLVRAPGLEPAALPRAIEATRLAPAMAAWLGVPVPRSALRAPPASLVPPGYAIEKSEPARLASLARQGIAMERVAHVERQRWMVPLAFLLALCALGPIKRAFGFDRSVPLAIVLVPALVLGAHAALGRPLSYSAIDTFGAHVLRVGAIGAAAAAVAFLTARRFAREGDARARTRRAAACVGWSALVCAMSALVGVGGALGPWELSARQSYVALLACGAAAPALFVVSLVLAASGLADRARARE